MDQNLQVILKSLNLLWRKGIDGPYTMLILPNVEVF